MTKYKKIRRAPGIYQRTTDRRKLTIKIPNGRTAAGKKRDIEIGFEGSVTDAKIERGRILAERKAGSFVEPSSQTVAAHLKNWLHDHTRREINAKTAERYGEIVDQITRYLGHIRLDKLRAPDIQYFYTQLLENGRRSRKKNVKGSQGLSKRTVLHHHRILKMALSFAVNMDLLLKNPCDRVEPPTPDDIEIKILKVDDTAHLIESAEDFTLYIPILLAATTGMRRGEVLGLRWCDVDLDAGLLSVKQTLQQTKSVPSASDEMTRRGLKFKPPKTKRSRRTIGLYPSVIYALRNHKVRQGEAMLSMGQGRDETGLVCPRADGFPRSPRAFSKEFRNFAKGLGFDKRLHDLRHGHISHLLAAGKNPRMVADRVGHASAKMTLDVYAHTLPTEDKDACKSLDAELQVHMTQ